MSKIKIETYTHGIKVTNFNESQFKKFKSYLNQLTLKEAVRNPRTGAIVLEEKKKYYGLTSDGKELYLHKECLEDFLNHLETMEVKEKDVRIIPVIVPKGKPAHYELYEKYVLRNYQEDIAEDFERPIHSHRVDLYTGYGKAQPLTSKILTTNGWTRMKDIKVGDGLIGANGEVQFVTGVTPQGIKDVYELKCEGKRKAKSCLEHLWEVTGDELSDSDILTTEELRIGLRNPNRNFYIPLPNLEHLDLPEKVKLESVEYCSTEETQCISVSGNDKLYITDDYLLTHNTLTSLAALARIKTKFIVMIPPKYFGLWTKALDETFKNIQGRYLTVSGSDNLKKLINRALDDDLKDIDIFIISNTTYRAFIDNYEEKHSEFESLGYKCTPLDFHRVLGVGAQINDEIQEDPGLLFRTDIYTNVNTQIYLSATPFTGNGYVTKMINKMLPKETQVRLPDYKVFINCLGIIYNEVTIKPKDYLTPYKNTYNHARYETQMLKSDRRTDKYFKMVKRLIDGLYIKEHQPEQKILVLCATVNFIGILVDYLRLQYPDYVVNEHVSGSPYERLKTTDIIVSTIKSAGTGVDIANLKETLLLQATDSKKDNLQILGRTRPLIKYPEITPRLTYVICENIPHHVRYHKNKLNHFKGRVKNSALRRIAL